MTKLYGEALVRRLWTTIGVLSCAAMTHHSAGAQSVPTGPIADLAARVAATEKKLAELQLGASRPKVFDAQGKFVGDVIADSPTAAIVEIPFRGTVKKLVLGPNGVTEGPGYSSRFFLTSDCSGPAYLSASRFDGTPIQTQYWGANFLLRNTRDGVFEYPRVGAVPTTVTYISVLANGGCFPVGGTGGTMAYAESDIVKIDPLAGLTAPYTLVR